MKFRECEKVALAATFSFCAMSALGLGCVKTCPMRNPLENGSSQRAFDEGFEHK